MHKPEFVSRNHHHHDHVVPLARLSLTLSRHFSPSFIASGRSSELHTVSSHSCCMFVRAGRLAFARPYVGVHRSKSLMSSSLLLQQCPACLVRLTWIVFVMGDRWPYSWCLVGCCRQDLFNIARNILVKKRSSRIKTHKILWNLEMWTDHLIPVRILINKKKRTCHLVKFAAQADQRVKVKGVKLDKYLDLNKLWNMKVTMILIVWRALGIVSKNQKRVLVNSRLEKESKPPRLQYY